MKNLIFLSFAFLILFSSCRKHNEVDPPSTDAAFLTFSIQNQVSSTIDPLSHTVSVIMPMGTSLDSLIAVFTSSEGSIVNINTVRQHSGITVNDFTSPLVYSIIAEDGSTRIDWTVSVSAIPNNSAEFFAFSVNNQLSADINSVNHTISIIVPLGTNIDSLIATYTTSPGSVVVVNTVEQVSGTTINNFSNPVTYTITAEDGITIINWIVTVNFEDYIYLSSDFPVGGNTYVINVDTLNISSYSIGSTGYGKIWSFTGLDIDVIDTARYSLASSHPSNASFPGATFVYRDNNLPFDLFGKTSTSQSEYTGVHVENSGMVFDLPMTGSNTSVQMKFPAQVGTTFNDIGTVQKDTLTTIPGIPIPVTVTIKVDFDISSEIDANGIITTPLGSFKCLREHRVQITTTTVSTPLGPLPYGGSDTIRTYNYLNKEKGYPVLTVEVDANGNIMKIKHQK